MNTFFNHLFDHHSTSSAAAKRNKRKPNRTCRIEELESREMLSVSLVEFHAIRELYTDVHLREDVHSYNIIEITADKLSVQSLQAAINTAGQTVQDDLIVVRTDGNHALTLDNVSLVIDIDADLFGSVHIVGFSGSQHQIVPLHISQTNGAALEITQGTVALAGMTFFGNEALFHSSVALPEILSVSEQAFLTTSNVGFFWQSEQIVYTERYADGTSRDFLLSETANLGFWTPYTWTDAVVLSSQESFFLGDNLFRSDQEVRLDVAVSNLGNQGIDNFSAQIWVNGKAIRTVDSLTLDAWQLGGMANVSLGTFAAGVHTVEVRLIPNDPNQETVRYGTSFTVTNAPQNLSALQNVRYEWDAGFAGYLLRWDAVAGASRYCVEITDAQGNVQRDYLLGTAAYLGKQNLLEAGSTIQVTAHNALTDSAAFVFVPIPGEHARGSWSDPIDPFNITDVIRTDGAVQRMYTFGYSDVSGQFYTAVPDQIYIDLIRQACAQWEKIITQGLLPDNRFAYLGPIDDLRIEFGFMDYGAGTILGTSYGGTNRTTANGGLPVTSTITYNTQYFTANPSQQLRDYFYSVVLHEIGHSLGYTTSLMNTFGLVDTTTVQPHSAMTTIQDFSTYYYYIGVNGVREFNTIFSAGMPYTGSGDRFLMETIARSGSFGSHISEVYATYFGGFSQRELMNWAATQGVRMSVSTITIGILDDLGYTVDYAMADPFGSFAPANLTVAASSVSGVSLAWDMPTGTASSFEVYRRIAAPDVDHSWTLLGTTTENFYTDTTIAGSTQYEYHVVAVNTVNVPQSAGLFEVASGGTLTWDAVPGAANYRVDRLTVADENRLSWSSLLLTTPNTSYNVGTAVGYTTYYHVIANGVSQARSQASSAVRVETVPITTPLSAPVLSTLTAVNSTTLSATWSRVENASGYRVEYSTNANFTQDTVVAQSVSQPGSGATVSANITGLTPGVTYHVRIVAVGDVLHYTDSSSSNVRNAATPTQQLSAPALSTLTATGAASLFASWNRVDNAVSYRIEYSTSADFASIFTQMVSQPVSGAAVTADIDDLASGTTYYLRVVAVGNGTNYTDSTVSNVLHAATPVTVPVAPTNLQSPSQTATDIELTWNPVGNAASYLLERSLNGTSGWTQLGGELTAASYRDTGLTAGTTYYYRVSAVNSAGTSPASAVLETKTVLPVPSAPTTLTNTEQTTTSLSFSWSASQYAAAYNVQYKVSSDSEWTSLPPQTGTTVTLSGLLAETGYDFRVQASNASGVSAWTTLTNVTTPAVPLLDPPINLRSTSTGQTVLELRWNTVAGAEEYVLQRSTDGTDFTEVYRGENARFVDQHLTAGTTYHYRVQADGSALSDSEPITTAAASNASGRPIADTPAILSAEINGNGEAVIEWTPLVGYTYTIIRAGSTLQSGFSTASYTDRNPLPIASYEVWAEKDGISSLVSARTVVWNARQQIEFTGFEYTDTGGIKLLWDVVPGLNIEYQVMRRGQLLGAGPNLAMGEFIHDNPQANNYYVLEMTYPDPITGRPVSTYSNEFWVPGPQPDYSPKNSNLDEFWNDFGWNGIRSIDELFLTI